jgi:hypothetical protein
MEEGIEWLMFLQSFQRGFDFDALIVSKIDDEWKGGTTGGE